VTKVDNEVVMNCQFSLKECRCGSRKFWNFCQSWRWLFVIGASCNLTTQMHPPPDV